MTILLILAIAISIRHAFEPDHIAAVLSVSTESNSLSATARQGAIWGGWAYYYTTYLQYDANGVTDRNR